MYRDSDLQTYFAQIHSYPRLSPEQQVELRQRHIRDNDQQAREEMIVANLRLVVHLAKKYAQRGLPLSDLIEEGNIGLVKAVERFNPDLNVRFSTYAAWWIQNRIRLALNKSRQLIQIPPYLATAVMNWKVTEAQMEEELGRFPRLEEIAARLGITLKSAEATQRAAGTYIRSDSQESSDGEVFPEMLDDDAESPDEIAARNEMLEQVHTLLNQIDQREAYVIRHRYGLQGLRAHSLHEIGSRLGLTRERARQIEVDALQSLQKLLDTNPAINAFWPSPKPSAESSPETQAAEYQLA